MEQNVVVAVFNVESEGFQALTELKNQPVEEKSVVTEAALLKVENGKCNVLDMFDSGAHTEDDAVFGGLLGMTVGILGGPIGMLFGAGYGTLVGMNFDAIDGLNEASMLEQIADKLDDGTVALAAMVYEEEPYAVDAKFSKFDTVIARFDAAVVAAEVVRAREMQAEIERQTRLALRKQKDEEFQAHVETTRKDMVAKFKEYCDSIEEDPNFSPVVMTADQVDKTMLF